MGLRRGEAWHTTRRITAMREYYCRQYLAYGRQVYEDLYEDYETERWLAAHASDELTLGRSRVSQRIHNRAKELLRQQTPIVLRGDLTWDLDTVIFHADMTRRLRAAVATLSERQQRVLTLRFGLADDRQRTFQEIADELGTTREGARSIELKALRLLRHPSRSLSLLAYASGYAYENEQEKPPEQLPAVRECARRFREWKEIA